MHALGNLLVSSNVGNTSGNKFQKKMVTRYKGILITAWYGTYKLSGKCKYLDFLYQTDFGAQNTQRFEMIEML